VPCNLNCDFIVILVSEILPIMLRATVVLLILISLSACSGNSGTEGDTLILGKGIITDHGMVVSAHPESSLIGTKILQAGGNAVDAAVATEFALAVCYPEAGNIGGGGFMVIRLADGKTDVIDYREKAPLMASRDMYLDNAGNAIDGLSTDTHLASGVPGTVDGMINAHSKYGILPFRDVIQPAIDLAEKGFPLTKGQASRFNSSKSVFLARNASLTSFVKDSLWNEGDTLVQKDLAGTLRLIRDLGREGFYSGKTARLIVKEMKRGNGIVSEQDLKGYKSVSRKPLTTDYKGFRVITVPPPSSGGIILIQLLEMTEPYPLKDWGFHSYKSIHLITEAERRSFADRSEYLGDPDFMNVKANQLFNSDYLLKRMSTFNEAKASVSKDINPGSPEAYSSEETTHYSVVDPLGNAVSATTTLNGTYGNSIVVDSAGFLLNNQMDDFSIKPGTPNMYGLVGGEVNSVRPGKKILSSMTPTIVEKDGKLFLVVGSPGGSTIPTSVYQVIINVIDFEMSIQNAVDAVRFHHQWLPDQISYEQDGIDSLTIRKLTEMGHTFAKRSSIGSINAIMFLSDGRIAGGADKRGNNSSCGY